MEERYHATTQNRFYPDMSNVNENITVEAKLTSPPTHIPCNFKQLLWHILSLASSEGNNITLWTLKLS